MLSTATVSGMDAQTAGKTARTLELLHSLAYFVPETEKELVGVGLEPGRMVYFAGRSAPLGAPPATVVTATFFNFNPELIASVIHVPGNWQGPQRLSPRGIGQSTRRTSACSVQT